MQRAAIALLIVLILSLTTQFVHSQGAGKIDIDELELLLGNRQNKLTVINFWATWCPPCVNELPHFEKVAKDFASEDVSFILVSLDFPSEYERRLIPFMKKHKITIPVFSMTETDANLWIDKVDAKWQGNIPATLFLNNARNIRYFISGELGETELTKIIRQRL
jgi:thiol-disulfide isomerase/thioredoxin